MSDEPVVTRCETVEDVADRAAEVLATAIDAARTVRGGAPGARAGGAAGGAGVGRGGARRAAGLATSTLDAPGATWHPLAVDLGCEGAAAAYAEELDGTVLDVALNGMGPDGHTASLFPGHPMARAEGIAVCVRDSPKPPSERVTLTLAKLNEARRILLVVTGAEKAPMLARVLAGADEDVPASWLARDRLEVIADAAALGG